MSEPSIIDQLGYDLTMAKQVEANATAARIEAEEKILACEDIKDKGTTKSEYYKIAVKPVTRIKIDAAAYDKIQKKIPAKINPVKLKPEVSATGLKDLKKANAKAFEILSKCVTSTPGKTSVTVEQIPAE